MRVVVGLSAVIMAVTGQSPRILTVRRSTPDPWGSRASGGELVEALPFGPLDPVVDRTLDLGLRRWVREQTGIELGYLEQLYTFGDRDRDPGARVLSVAYLALTRQVAVEAPGAAWRDLYTYLPWEDWREGVPGLVGARIVPGLRRWAQVVDDPGVTSRRWERVTIAFGVDGAPWDRNRVLERYELLYEARLVPEARSVPGGQGPDPAEGLGWTLALDHRRIAATALERLRGKLGYRPVVFEMLPATFTLSRMQQVVEALAGLRLHKQNFRRLVEQDRLVERTGEVETGTGGRPAETFRFRREVLRERPAPGVGLPGRRRPRSPASG
ncbi:MAG: NUDIX hydrolase [Actinomycetes bacterium]